MNVVQRSVSISNSEFVFVFWLVKVGVSGGERQKGIADALVRRCPIPGDK